VFLVRSLEAGGAERQLVELVRSLDSASFCVTVVTFYPGGILESDLCTVPGVRLETANKHGRWDVASFLLRLWKVIRRTRPHVVHAYMYGANEVAWLLGRASGARVVWGIRASNMDLQHYDSMTRLLFKSGALLSSRIDLIISNSYAGRAHHLRLGYAADKFIVISNGIDTKKYRRDTDRSTQLRAQWGVDQDCQVVGLVARVDPMKDHETFLRATAIAASRLQRARFVIIGNGTPRKLAALHTLAQDLGVEHLIIWAGAHRDMTAVHGALDVATSSSAFGEGFSNSLAEAMACETVCVATDVGDARIIIGDTGEIVPPRDAKALAEAWLRVLKASSSERAERGRRARKRIVENFGVRVLARRTSEMLLQVAAGMDPAAH
jgi:glycosyltransferase involved in cell wall biosynthesis